MALPTGFWGLDIGQCALKALRLEIIDGKPTATAFDFVEHPKILSQPDADPDQLTREALEKFLSRNSLKGDNVAIAVAGQSGLARFVKLPPVEEKRIGDIVKFEAKQQIPFPLEEVVWDYQKIAGGEVAGGFAMETEIGLFAMKRDNIARAMGHFNGAGVDVHLVQMAPLAICNYATYELLGKGGPDGSTEPGAPVLEGVEDESPRGKKRCAVIMDIGTDASNLIITDGGKIIWQRPIPLGGNNFTRALTKEMKLTFAKAEHLKRNAAKSPDLPAILKALRPVLTDFVGEVQRSLGYFTNTHRDAHVAYMIGLGNAFKLPGLQKYLEEKLSLKVRKPVGVTRLAGDQVLSDPVLTENVLSFPIAYGLALQGIGQARIVTNLLPPEIRVDRQIRIKKPWAAAAAAALLLGTGTVTGAYALQNSRVTDSTIKAALDKVKSASAAADAQASEETKKKGELDDTIKEVKSIIAGQDERLNWIRLNEVITAALPKPGPDGNLTEPAKAAFWSTDKGKRAMEKYFERLRAGLPADQAWEDDQSQYLATVNVEAIYTRYTDDVGAFLKNADDAVKRAFNEDIAKFWNAEEKEQDEETKRWKPKVSEEKKDGWIVEIRGYTNHELGTQGFVERCLLDNFVKLSKFAELTEVDPVTKKSKVGNVIPGMPDPIKSNVRTPFLYLVKEAPPLGNGVFKYINGNYADTLISAAPAAGLPGEGGDGMALGGGRGMPGSPAGGGGSPDGGMPGGPGMMGGGASNSLSGWRPLAPGAAGGAGGMGLPGEGGMGMPGGGPRGGMPGPGIGFGGGGASPPAGLSGIGSGAGGGISAGGGGSADGGEAGPGPGGMLPGGGGLANPGLTTPKGKPKNRTEFVLFFIWKEPTPSDPTPVPGESGGSETSGSAGP